MHMSSSTPESATRERLRSTSRRVWSPTGRLVTTDDDGVVYDEHVLVKDLTSGAATVDPTSMPRSHQTPIMDDVEFRAGVTGDAPEMSAVHHRCFVTAFIDLVTPREAVTALRPDKDVERFTEWLSDFCDVSVTVAAIGGVPVAYAAVRGHELLHLFVDPAYAGRGLGRVLLADAEDRIAADGHAEAELHTIVGNEPAIGLYRSAGWEMTDELLPDSHDGVTYDEHVMRKRL